MRLACDPHAAFRGGAIGATAARVSLPHLFRRFQQSFGVRWAQLLDQPVESTIFVLKKVIRVIQLLDSALIQHLQSRETTGGRKRQLPGRADGVPIG